MESSDIQVKYTGFELVTSGADEPAPAPGDDTPKTGDVMNVVVLAGLAVVALGGVVVCANKKNA